MLGTDGTEDCVDAATTDSSELPEKSLPTCPRCEVELDLMMETESRPDWREVFDEIDDCAWNKAARARIEANGKRALLLVGA